VLVEIVEILGFLSYKILATDGTLFPHMPGTRAAHISVKIANSLNLKESLKRFAKEFSIVSTALKRLFQEKKFVSKCHARLQGFPMMSNVQK
jgi:hypothetical protein